MTRKAKLEKALAVEEPNLVPTKYKDYFVDIDGNIWSKKNQRGVPLLKRKLTADRWGYLQLVIILNGKRKNIKAHRIVCEAFHGEKPSTDHEVRHLNGIKTDNSAANLSWGTHLENMADSSVHGVLPQGSKHGCAKLSEKDIPEIRQLFKEGTSRQMIASKFGVSATAIGDVLAGRRWKHVHEALSKIDKALGEI